MKRIIIIALILFLFVIGVLIGARYSYKQKITALEQVADPVRECAERFRSEFGNYPDAAALNAYLPACRPDLAEAFATMKFGIITDPHLVTIYEYGFDGRDDFGGVLYPAGDISLSRSFLIVGDALVARINLTSDTTQVEPR